MARFMLDNLITSLNNVIKAFKSLSSTGIFRVSKKKDKSCNQRVYVSISLA